MVGATGRSNVAICTLTSSTSRRAIDAIATARRLLGAE
eukprot:COSAG04_NODE_4144_length_2272_cov_1028.351127_2_plen_38_part_00